jgi:DinB superfamily
LNRASIDQYERDATLPAKAIAGLSTAELNSFPIAGTWSIQQCIMHLLDSDLVGSDRMKRVIAEPTPTLLAYDETLFVKNLYYEQLDPANACEIFRLNRIMMAAILRRCPDEAFKRTGNHTERGIESLEMLVEGYVEHLQHHMNFVREKRQKLGKPMAD